MEKHPEGDTGRIQHQLWNGFPLEDTGRVIVGIELRWEGTGGIWILSVTFYFCIEDKEFVKMLTNDSILKADMGCL